MPPRRPTPAIAAFLILSASTFSAALIPPRPNYNLTSSTPQTSQVDPFALFNPSLADRPPECPPCFNCLLPAFSCLQFGKCDRYDGQCRCPEGFGGQDCGKPLCGSLANGKQRYPREGESCECSDGWTGINCNVCQMDQSCDALIPRDDTPLEGGGENKSPAVCYKGGFAVKQVHQMCDVTNRKILDMLPDRPPQVTFTCDTTDQTCGFQFWIGKVESFYCGLSNCSVDAELSYQKNVTEYQCDKVECSCIPGKMLCGEDGSVDITDFLKEDIRGPGKFTCASGSDCKFEEPAMNQLINDIFGDQHITLDCNAGECLHYSQVPGFKSPEKPDNSAVLAVSIALAGLIVFGACLLFWYLGRIHKHPDYKGSISLPSDEAGKLMTDHIPAALHFNDVSYTVNNRTVLSGISGSVLPGQIMAIMGASGAGKSTFLDILARKTKMGSVSGEILVNGKKIPDSKYKRVIGFVDQEDLLMGTLTVYETVLYSALLRLPRDMSLEAKKFRTLETMHELGILGIKDSRIGDSGHRSISGGEKRRVSIACELVTSPSILFLDEPTSGLDSYNASNVVESLVALARDYNRTVVFTIHQPRSNIVAMFDRLVLLAKGMMVYSGQYEKCADYFDKIGHPCPMGFNIADYLIDLTMQDEKPISSNGTTSLAEVAAEEIAGDRPDEENGLGESRSRGTSTPADSSATPDVESTELQLRGSASGPGSTAGLRSPAWFSSLTKRSSSKSNGREQKAASPKLAELIEEFEKSDVFASIRTDRENLGNGPAEGSNGGSNGTAENNDADIPGGDALSMRGYKRAGLWTQFRILSGRAFKNLYRNPQLLLTHYVISVLVALICAYLFRGVTNDIPGFQNRMGLFFFILALFGFSCLTSLGVFASERVLFMRERANGYYSPFTFFASKVLFDIVPLRVVPPFILGAIIYGPVGLVPTVAAFWKFISILVLFNLVASSVVFFISIVIADYGVANLVGSLVMLFNLLFAGQLINRDKLPFGVGWLQVISFFHASFEALLVNEVRYLQLKETKWGVDIDVPAATILSIFGFQSQAFWFPDFTILVIYFVLFITFSFLALLLFVKERR